VRIRVSAGGSRAEFVGQDYPAGLNSWKGAADKAVERAEEWVEARAARSSAGPR
jgi:hypothetical protein